MGNNKSLSYVGRNLEDLNEFFDSQSDDLLYEIETLDLSNNKIKDISPLVRLKASRDKYPKLRELYLTGNLIEEIPESIIDIFGRHLKVLDISDNKLKSIPNNFIQLISNNQTKEINLKKNCLTSFFAIEIGKDGLDIRNHIKLNLSENPIRNIDDNLIGFLRDLSYEVKIPSLGHINHNYKPFLYLVLPENLSNQHDKLLSFQQDFDKIDFERVHFKKNLKKTLPGKFTEISLSEIMVSNLNDEDSRTALGIVFDYYNYLEKFHGVILSYGESEPIILKDKEWINFRTGTSYVKNNRIINTNYIEQYKVPFFGHNCLYSIPYFKNLDIDTLVNHHLKWDISLKDFIFNWDTGKFINRDKNVSKSENTSNNDGNTSKGFFNLALLAGLTFGILYGLYKLITLIF